MPVRKARSSVQIAAPKGVRIKARKRNLDAYATASHQTTEKSRIKRSRLGEVADDEPRRKRQRSARDDDDEEDESEDDRQAGPAKKRRSAPGGDDIEQGSDSEGNEWMLGALASDDEDSDLDSDEAFGDSDEERFEGFTFRGSSSTKPSRAKKVKQRKPDNGLHAETNLDEDGDESMDSEEELEAEGVDLATMLDDDADGRADSASDSNEDSASFEKEESGDESASSFSDMDEEEDGGADEERVARLHKRLEAMDKNDQVANRSPNSNQLSPSKICLLTSILRFEAIFRCNQDKKEVRSAKDTFRTLAKASTRSPQPQSRIPESKRAA